LNFIDQARNGVTPKKAGKQSGPVHDSSVESGIGRALPKSPAGGVTYHRATASKDSKNTSKKPAKVPKGGATRKSNTGKKKK